ncbi:MAG: zinc ABC transporter substrate-binding protein [Ruminococcus sp.]|nr:zinc ABC transporter substrate-binding protein [Ruminococcus sp.]
MRFRKTISAVLCAAMVITSFTGCGSASGGKSSRLSIVCTTFPEYDWIRHILGDHLADTDLTCLAANGTDMHSFQPTAEDMIKISACDLFVYVGGESDKWVEDALADAKNEDMKVVSLLDELGSAAKEEEVKEGMEAEAEEEDEDEDEDEGPEYDEHVWLSLRNAANLCYELEVAVSAADPSHAGDYMETGGEYIEELNKLNDKYKEFFKEMPKEKRVMIFGDRFPFRYFTDDYKIDYYAAFVGCSAETEASFSTIAFLSEKADELGVDDIFILEGSDGAIANAVISNTKKKDMQIVKLDSMQSVTDLSNTYLNIMEQNYETIREAMS